MRSLRRFRPELGEKAGHYPQSPTIYKRFTCIFLMHSGLQVLNTGKPLNPLWSFAAAGLLQCRN